MAAEPIKAGATLPTATLQEGAPDTTVVTTELFAGKTVALFAVPGAFTPTCSADHLPSYMREYDALKAAGVDLVVCVSVNDVFVMKAWGKDQAVGDNIRMLADPLVEFSKAIGLATDIPVLGGMRSQRYSMLIKDNVVKNVNIEASKPIKESLADVILAQAKAL